MTYVIALGVLAGILAVTVEICRRAAKEKRHREEHKLMNFYCHKSPLVRGALVMSEGDQVAGHINGNVRFSWTPDEALSFAQLLWIAAMDIKDGRPVGDRLYEPGSISATNGGERVRTGPNCGGCGRELPEEQKP